MTCRTYTGAFTNLAGASSGMGALTGNAIGSLGGYPLMPGAKDGLYLMVPPPPMSMSISPSMTRVSVSATVNWTPTAPTTPRTVMVDVVFGVICATVISRLWMTVPVWKVITSSMIVRDESELPLSVLLALSEMAPSVYVPVGANVTVAPSPALSPIMNVVQLMVAAPVMLTTLRS